MIHQLQDEEIRQFTIKTLNNGIDLQMTGYSMSKEMAWDVMMKAASEYRSITSVCKELVDSVHYNTLLDHVNTRFDVCELLTQELDQNLVLAATIPRSLRGRAIEVAVDFHDEPYYGKHAECRLYTCRGQAKSGTTRFWRIASAYAMKQGQRVTLAMCYILPEYTTVEVLDRLLHRIQQQGLGIKRLYMDKGFCSTAIIRYLQTHNIPAIIPCPIRGTTGGTRALCHGRKSYTTSYCFSDGTTATLCCVLTHPRDKHGKRRDKWLLFVTIGVAWSPQKALQRYRYRFGIETSYRQMRQLRIFTTSCNPAVRFFFYGFALLLLNIWTFLRWAFTRHPGTRRIESDVLPLARFKSLLRAVIERLRRVANTIPVYLSPTVLKL